MLPSYEHILKIMCEISTEKTKGILLSLTFHASDFRSELKLIACVDTVDNDMRCIISCDEFGHYGCADLMTFRGLNRSIVKGRID